MNIDEYEEHIYHLIQSNQLDQITRYISGPQDQTFQCAYDLRLKYCLLDPRYQSMVSLSDYWKIIHRVLPPSAQDYWITLFIVDTHGLEGILTSVEGGWMDVKDPSFILSALMRCRKTIDVQLAFIDRLIELGLNVNDCVYDGHTLLYDILRGYWARAPQPFYDGPSYCLLIVSHLLERGADPLLEGKHGESAIDYARSGRMVKRRNGRIEISPQLLTELEKWA